MSKSVIVVDTPESCSKCRFSYEYYGVKKCQLLNILANGGKAIIPKYMYTECRHEECPLVALPEKIPEPIGFEEMSTSVKRVGWNACIDAILGQ